MGLDHAAEALTRQALAFFATQANNSAEAQALGILGQFANLRGECEEALALYDEGLARLNQVSDP